MMPYCVAVMKKNILSTFSVQAFLLLIATVWTLCGLAACVAIPNQAMVVSGNNDWIIARDVTTCTAGRETSSSIGRSDNAINPEDFTILSWNAQKGAHNDWGKDLVTYAEDVDLILLQEASLDPQLKRHLKLLARKWLLAVAYQVDGKDIGVLSAGPIAASFSCATREPEPLLTIPKMILVSQYPLTGMDSELLLINLHVVNFTLGSDIVRRQLDTVSTIIEQHQGPVIVCGDFNTWSSERKSVVKEIMTNHNMEAVLFEPDNRSVFLGNIVDKVFYRGLEVIQAAIHRVETSDHNPLEVQFRIQHGGKS